MKRGNNSWLERPEPVDSNFTSLARPCNFYGTSTIISTLFDGTHILFYIGICCLTRPVRLLAADILS